MDCHGAGTAISFFVNKRKYEVSNVDPTLSLNLWLRQEACLTGTKWMCNEGGCGSCAVLMQYPGQIVQVVNSCLVLLASANGCHITTVEGVGSSQIGFSKVQSKLVKHNAIQCGYCTPGFVMSMQGMLLENTSPSQKVIENNFDGNICRCTGYRPILDAMKCFSCDKSQSSGDIEDLVSKRSQFSLNDYALKVGSFQYSHKIINWIRVVSFLELKELLKKDFSFKIISGNTSSGIFKSTKVHSLYLDISKVAEFQSIIENSDSIEFGASVTLTRMANFFSQISKQSVTFEPIALHILKIAGSPVRNIASWAGNVMLKQQHNEFPSDVCTLLQAANVVIKVYDVASDSFSTHTVYGSNGIVNLNMKKKIIVSMTLPKIENDGRTKMKSYKIMPRSQNSYAYVNAAFLAKLNGDRSTINKLTLVFGAVSLSFHQATATENYMIGKEINSNETLKGALKVLRREVSLSCNETFKTNLVLGLFYKFYLFLCDASQIGRGLACGVDSLIRPISSGTQTYKTDPSTYPVSKSTPKLSGIFLASGEAEFISDSIPSRTDLYCDVVLSQVGNAEIDVIDSSKAERLPGFVQIVTKDNFPSDVKNAWLGASEPALKMISEGKIYHSGQIVAVVIAESLLAARRIAAAVRVTYRNIEKPVINWKDAVDANSYHDVKPHELFRGNVDQAMHEAEHTVTGELVFEQQYHFYMETIACKAQHTDDRGFTLFSSTQGQTLLQSAIAYAFGVPLNKVEVLTKRMGGAYGGKASNSQLPSCIAALAAHVTNRPVHFQTTMETCMKMLGTRTPYTVQYKVGFDADGLIKAVDQTVYLNSGCSSYDQTIMKPENFSDSAYFCENRRCIVHLLKSNLPMATWFRAPGTFQMMSSADLMVDHVASYLKKNPVDVKMANLYKIGQNDINQINIPFDFRQICQKLFTKYRVRGRMQAVETFNQTNRWKKKGIAVTPMKYGIHPQWVKFGVLLSIYAFDGTVVVSHGGIDSGQGINIKVAQVVAYKLGIPLDMVTVQRTTTVTSANSETTSGSVTSESVCQSAISCCDILNSRIEPVRKMVGDDLPWAELIKTCYDSNVDLTAASMSPPFTNRYFSFGVTAAEVEYDVITGERQILQVDTVFDCGMSLNPAVDVGQIEGAFMMGVGFWLSEKMSYDKTSGRLLTDGTWEYKPPASQDIPIKWNIELLEDHPNTVGVLRSKACGEPPLCMSVCVALAIKRAVEATRRDRGIESYFPLPIPATVDAMHDCCLLDPIEDFTLN